MQGRTARSGPNATSKLERSMDRLVVPASARTQVGPDLWQHPNLRPRQTHVSIRLEERTLVLTEQGSLPTRTSPSSFIDRRLRAMFGNHEAQQSRESEGLGGAVGTRVAGGRSWGIGKGASRRGRSRKVRGFVDVGRPVLHQSVPGGLTGRREERMGENRGGC